MWGFAARRFVLKKFGEEVDMLSLSFLFWMQDQRIEKMISVEE